jgi:integrase
VRVNPRNRKLNVTRPKRAYPDRAEQVAALLDAAGEMDDQTRSNARVPRRALLTTLTFAGLRIGEALELRWRDGDLAGGAPTRASVEDGCRATPDLDRCTRATVRPDVEPSDFWDVSC